jgi:PHP family Zn ribbon phosphoesterase
MGENTKTISKEVKQNIATLVQSSEQDNPNARYDAMKKAEEFLLTRPLKTVKKKVVEKKVSRAEFLAKEPVKSKKYSLDLRIHSPATTGYFSTGGLEHGAALVRLARAKGLDMIGLTDFYSVSFLDYVVKELRTNDALKVLPGFDIRCQTKRCNEIFFTALFPENTKKSELEKVLESLTVPVAAAGKKDFIIPLEIKEVIRIIEDAGGITIPTRMDKTPYRQLAIASLIEDYGYHTFDLVHPDHTEFFFDRWPSGRFTFLSFSNAYSLAQVATRVTDLKLDSAGFAGIKQRFSRRVS